MTTAIAPTSSTTPTGASVASAAAEVGGQLGKDQFLQMLVAQLRNQDPMNPMQTDQMAAQLAQFSSVEQLVQMNQQMQSQAALLGQLAVGLNASAGLAALGRDVVASGSSVVVPPDGTGSVTVDVGAAGGHATLHLYDTAGNEVGSRELGEVDGGRQKFDLGSAADGLTPGLYDYSVTVTNSAGEEVPVTTYVTGHVDGLQYTASGPVLTAGALTIPFGSILEIAAAQ